MKKDLRYDNFSEDKGVFWMSFEAVCQWFEVIHLNWNPDSILKYRKNYFDCW